LTRTGSSNGETMAERDARATFEGAIARTRDRSPATFDQWFGSVQFDDWTGEVLTLRAQNEFVLDWVRTNFLPELREQLFLASGIAVQVNWILDPRLERPIAAAPMTATASAAPRTP
jgi:chromosomal replication initiator protein